MVLYFQEFAAGPNATLIPVAGIAGKLWTFSQFETVFLTDAFITEMPDPDSPMVGRGQGITHTMFSIVFTNQAYNGSTLEIQGIGKQFEAVREYSVVGGIGKFRFARGYTTFETISMDMPRVHSVIQHNVTIRLD
ncbi:hypothetical protein ACJRO7_001660 [Eucalyptus globulus]|uniref:Dirigent protein n=1 Tax=Eucalyptus globulus TaxID=34317 RepID=A0ABD3LXD2_EUCGL